MDMIRLGKKGQVSLPKKMLKEAGVRAESVLLVETTPEGGILLRPAGVYPIERYSKDRVREFLEEDRLSSREAKRVKDALNLLL